MMDEYILAAVLVLTAVLTFWYVYVDEKGAE